MSANLVEGSVFAGRYRVVRCLAAGGMGAVYEVIHLETNRRRALKVMHPHLFQSEEMRQRFKLEARIAAEVESEYIVDVSDAGVDEATKTPFLVMELLRGEELGARLKRMRRLPPEEVVVYMQQAAWALDRTHAASIVHRDLKPANLFLTTREDGTPRIKILDFGVAKLIAEGATADGTTRSLGTPLYMAPEQFRADIHALTPAADIHALTLMTYTLLVGKAYWAEELKSAGHVIALAILIMKGPQESAVQRAARYGVVLPPGFDAWFARGTAVNPADRFPTATEAVRSLGLVVGLASPGAGPTAPRPAMRSDAGMPTPVTDVVLTSSHLMDREATSTSTGAASLTVAVVARSRAPLVAAAAMLGLGVLGAGAWMALRPASAGPEAATQIVVAAISAAPAASSAAPVESAPSAVVAPVAPSASATAVAAPSAAVAAAARPKPAGGGTATPKPASPAKRPIKAAPDDYTRR